MGSSKQLNNFSFSFNCLFYFTYIFFICCTGISNVGYVVSDKTRNCFASEIRNKQTASRKKEIAFFCCLDHLLLLLLLRCLQCWQAYNIRFLCRIYVLFFFTSLGSCSYKHSDVFEENTCIVICCEPGKRSCEIWSIVSK